MAQLIDRNVLFELAKQQDSVEESENSLSYSEFIELYRNAFNSYNKDVEKTYRQMCRFLKTKCPPIRFINDGSSRVAFDMAGGKCLKIAKNQKGIALNKQEIKNIGSLRSRTKWSCFTANYAYDKETNASILTECCSEAVEDDFIKSFGMVLDQMMYEIRLLVTQSNRRYTDPETIVKYHLELLAEPDLPVYEKKCYTENLEFWTNVIKNKAPLWDVIRDLLKFYKVKGTNVLETGDLEVYDNWGLAIRNGEVVPVIIDAGLSSAVFKKHYDVLW